MSMAKVILVGNLGRDPETRYTPNGKMNVHFTMATNRKWTDQSGQQQERTTWFNITSWGRLAETIDGFAQQGSIRKGTLLFVLGRLETREYQDQNGQTRTSLDVTADEIQFMGGRGEGEAMTGGGSGRRDSDDQSGGGPGAYDTQDIDDIPF
jgi:single-strand DNA-binding protein